MISAPLPQPPLRSLADDKVLFLLSEKEWGLFFPEGFSLPGVEVLDVRADGRTAENMLRSVSPEVVVTSWSTPRFSEALLGKHRTLQYICHTSGSVRQLIPRSFLEEGVIVTNWGTLAADAVAEHALLLILTSLRRSPEWPPVISGKLPWQPSPIWTQTLFGKRIGIHGFGNVAQALVRLLRPFSISISAFSIGVPKEIFEEHDVHSCESLEELFAGNEILIDCEALNPLTAGSVSRAVLEELPKGALFVNVGRGAIVDEAALAELVAKGRFHAALDVFDRDPISPVSPLHNVPGIVMSPHIAGPTSDQMVRCGELARRNLVAYFTGMPLTARVTLEIFDRAT